MLDFLDVVVVYDPSNSCARVALGAVRGPLGRTPLGRVGDVSELGENSASAPHRLKPLNAVHTIVEGA